MRYMIIVDVGSTTSKALLFGEKGQGWRLLERGESGTTVEAPYEDVTVGVRRAISIIQERTKIPIIQGDDDFWQLLVEDFLATSSAGGGLQMVVCGNIGKLSAESAERAAMGGGAILLDVFAVDDGLSLFQRMERLRSLRPDMVLLSGGVEGAQVANFLVEMCDFIRTARPRPKFGYSHDLPVIYAGTSSGVSIVEDLLGEGFVVKTVANLRPSITTENLEPTREAIHDLFIEHVMSHAPGYGRLQERVSLPLMPTPTAVGDILTIYARSRKINVLCIDIGGATTDVFSVVAGNFVRTVSANLGMSYSIGNVAAATGVENLMRWIPHSHPLSDDDLLNRIGNKLLFPVTIPAVLEDLWAEQAAGREALRLSFIDHQEIAKVQKPQGIFADTLTDLPEAVEIDAFDLIIGSGGVLSNTPLRGQAAAILLDAFQPIGVTQLMVDSVFMLPHLGAFARIDETGALAILEQDCLIPLGTALAPLGWVARGNVGLTISGKSCTGRDIQGSARGGELVCVPLGKDETAEIQVSVSGGARWSGDLRVTVRGGVSGIILDMRGRPLLFDKEHLTEYPNAWLLELTKGERQGGNG